VKCPQCQFDNPAQQKFCGECGARLQLLCPGCGVANPPGFKFCGECGVFLAPLAGSTGGPAGGTAGTVAAPAGAAGSPILPPAAEPAAIAQVDPEQLYYLTSRGLRSEVAQRLIIDGERLLAHCRVEVSP